MKIMITNDDYSVAVARDFSDLDKTCSGLIGQIIMELELLKEELLSIYISDDGEED